MSSAQVAIDIGGTFTDVAVRWADGSVDTQKLSSSRSDPGAVVAAALERIAVDRPESRWTRVLHGTTVATNALLEKATSPAALVTTRGFRDVLQIGRMKRSNLYSIGWQPIAPLVPRDRIYEVDERMGADGVPVASVSAADLEDLTSWIAGLGVETIAVCLLNSYANPKHERAVADHVAAQFPQLHVTASLDVAPEVGEYERTSTTVVHAVLKPIVSRYIGDLETIVRSNDESSRLFVMQSNGGLATSRQIIEEPARAVESGPAAGALYASVVARRENLLRAISFDMGGTTAKACLLDGGAPAETSSMSVGSDMHAGEGFKASGGYVIRERAIDLVEIGAGGGSLCRVDEQGVVHVGPSSAGAMPGPVAYGRGGLVPTVTDANLVLGFLPTGASADVTLDLEGAREAVRKCLAEPLGVTIEEAAWVVFQVANSNMMRAIQAVSSERGRDPAGYTLIAFGGAGPTHAAAIAGELGMSDVLVPTAADCFSAVGLHTCSARRDTQMPFVASVSDVDRGAVDRAFEQLEAEARRAFALDGMHDPTLRRLLDVRFRGQNTVLNIEMPAAASGALGDAIRVQFIEMHRSDYGHADVDAPVEMVALRLRAEVSLGGDGHLHVRLPAALGAASARIYLGPQTGFVDARRYPLDGLGVGEVIEGPALIQAGQATVVVPPGSTAVRDELSNVRLTTAARKNATLPGGGWEGRAGLQLFRNALGAVLDRMAYTIARTAYSTMATESNDFSVAIGDHQGRVLDQGVGVLIHLGSVASALETLMKSDLLPLAPGDVVLLNDPYNGGTHLPDFIVIAPVFVRDEIVAYSVAISHMIDVGGLVPGSFMANARELLQEGLVIPPLRLYDDGRPNRAVFDIIGRNVRQPHEVIGDLHGLVAAVKLGATRIGALVGATGVDQARGLMEELIDYSVERGRHELRALGTAQATFVDYLDDDGVSTDPVRVAASLRFEDGEVWADFTGSSPQVAAGINSTISTTRSIVQYCIRTQMTEDFPDNAGFHSLLHISADPGTVVSSSGDAPVANRGMTAFRLVDAIFGAMAEMFPGAIWAAGDGSLDPLTFGGVRPDGGRFTLVDIVGGTTGARPWADGVEGVSPPVGNSRNVPVEILEARYPIRILHYGYAPGTGGGGRYRGGNAITRAYELLCDEAEVAVRSDRKTHRPWGLDGGESGAPSLTTLIGADDRMVELPSKHVFRMKRGERLIRRGAGGGGYGDRNQRDPELAERDRREGRTDVPPSDTDVGGVGGS